jgi:hypothetical protein
MNEKRWFLCLASFTALGGLQLVQAEEFEDTLFGDWEGQSTIGSETQNWLVRMIPHGWGHYRARFYTTFEKKEKPPHDLVGILNPKDSWGGFLDNIPFEAWNVKKAEGGGVIFEAARWHGKLEGAEWSGVIDGKTQGSFKLTKRAAAVSPTLGQKAPEGALVLFDGTSLAAWTMKGQEKNQPPAEATWKLVDGAMQVQHGHIISREALGSGTLHLEFCTPYMASSSGQGRANSGVYLQSRYEVQVLDSYGLEGEDNECGGIYRTAKPAVNMCFPPLQWQTYDIDFTAAVFENGEKKANAKISVTHNGVKIIDQVEIENPTGGAHITDESQPGGLMLQDHGNPVKFRNIWWVKR